MSLLPAEYFRTRRVGPQEKTEGEVQKSSSFCGNLTASVSIGGVVVKFRVNFLGPVVISVVFVTFFNDLRCILLCVIWVLRNICIYFPFAYTFYICVLLPLLSLTGAK